MRHIVIFALACAVGAPLHARLPPPTPEQEAAAAKKKEEEAQKAKEQQDALTRVQDRIAAKFGRGGKGAGPTEAGKLPDKAVEAPRTAGPTGGTAQSAEAHSTQKQ